jgi:hypothetical protein
LRQCKRRSLNSGRERASLKNGNRKWLFVDHKCEFIPRNGIWFVIKKLNFSRRVVNIWGPAFVEIVGHSKSDPNTPQPPPTSRIFRWFSTSKGSKNKVNCDQIFTRLTPYEFRESALSNDLTL